MNAGEAVAQLAAVVEDLERATRRVEAGSQRADDALGRLRASFRGSTNPRSAASLERLAKAETAVDEAVRLLEASDADIRAYAQEAFGTSLPGDGQLRRPFGSAFTPGAFDPGGLFDAVERRVADRLAEEGVSVHPRRADHSLNKVRHPDALARWSPEDPGTITEFKTLESGEAASDVTVRNAIKTANKQLPKRAGGDVVIDARPTQVTAAQAGNGYRRALGEFRQRGVRGPNRVLVILRSGQMIDVSREGR